MLLESSCRGAFYFLRADSIVTLWKPRLRRCLMGYYSQDMSEITAELAASGGKGSGRGVRGAGEAAKGHNVRERRYRCPFLVALCRSGFCWMLWVGAAVVSFCCCELGLFVV